ncbi:MAG: hypothetical protein WCY46_08200 [Tissierellaceae bacterium]
MKRLYLIFFLIFMSLSVFSNPLARLYQVDNPVFQAIEELSIEVGVVPFTASGPVSGYELYEQLVKISHKSQSDYIKNKTETAKQLILNPFNDKTWDFSIQANLEAYLNVDSSAEFYDWVNHYNSRLPLVNAEVETIFGDSGYAVFAYGLKKSFNTDDFNQFSNNTPFGKGSGGFEDSYPNTALLSISGKWFSLIAGRDAVKFGRGETGNLMLSDHVPYHDFFAINLFNKKVRYTLMAIPMNELISQSILDNIFPGDSNKPKYQKLLGTSKIPNEYIKDEAPWFTLYHGSYKRTYITHRLEIELFDWWRLAVTEGTMFYLDSNDIRMFNPLMFNHNLQSFGEVNNSIGLETEIAISPNWALDFQIFLDQWQTKQEQNAYDDIPPNAYAFLLNARYLYSLNNWKFKGFIESVYTSPFVYMRAGDSTANYGDGDPKKEYNLDFVHAVSRADRYSGVNWLGYPYGPDTIVIAKDFTGQYKDLFSLSTNLRFIIQGERGLKIHNKEQEVILYGQGDNINPITPSGNSPGYTFVVGLGGSFKVPKANLSFNVQNYLINKWQSNKYVFDNQLTLSISYKL